MFSRLVTSSVESGRLCRWPTTVSMSGGAERDRTDDLRHAKPALSQLSYSPVFGPLRRAPPRLTSLWKPPQPKAAWQLTLRQTIVGRGRVELPTSRLSGVRSNHLSYRPEGKHMLVPESACSLTSRRDECRWQLLLREQSPLRGQSTPRSLKTESYDLFAL